MTDPTMTKCSVKCKSVFVVFMIGDSVAVGQWLPLQPISALAVRSAPAGSYASSHS